MAYCGIEVSVVLTVWHSDPSVGIPVMTWCVMMRHSHLLLFTTQLWRWVMFTVFWLYIVPVTITLLLNYIVDDASVYIVLILFYICWLMTLMIQFVVILPILLTTMTLLTWWPEWCIRLLFIDDLHLPLITTVPIPERVVDRLPFVAYPFTDLLLPCCCPTFVPGDLCMEGIHACCSLSCLMPHRWWDCSLWLHSSCWWCISFLHATRCCYDLILLPITLPLVVGSR